MTKHFSLFDYEYIHIIPAERDTEFLHDVARHEASAMFGERGPKWMVWIADDAVILGFAHRKDWAKFAKHWSLLFLQLIDEGSLADMETAA